MSAVRGRARSPRPRDHYLVQTWVAEDVYRKVRKAADVAGMSIRMYLEELVSRDEVDADGRPLWAVADDEADTLEQELPLKTA